jgi:hypothetical protein
MRRVPMRKIATFAAFAAILVACIGAAPAQAQEDGVGFVSARGSDQAIVLASPNTQVVATFSAITNCDEAQNTRPFFVRWTHDGTTFVFKKNPGAIESNCYIDESGTKHNDGLGTGLVNGTCPATVDWDFADGVDSGFETVDIGVSPECTPSLDLGIGEPPTALNGSPGGVWAFETTPWPVEE